MIRRTVRGGKAERGEGNARFIVYLAFLGILGYLDIRNVPVFFNVQSLKSDTAELARTTGVAFESGDALLDRIRRQPVPRKAREQSSEEKPMVKSKDTPRDVLQRAVDAMPQQRFSFEDLRAKVTDDYDAVRDALFELLDTPHSGVKQVFDAKTKTLMFERVSK